MYLTFATMHGFSAFSFIMRTSLFCFEFFMRYPNHNLAREFDILSPNSKFPAVPSQKWVVQRKTSYQIQWLVFASNDRAMADNLRPAGLIRPAALLPNCSDLMASLVVYFINLPSALCCAINVLYVAFWAFVTNCENQELNLIKSQLYQRLCNSKRNGIVSGHFGWYLQKWRT